MMEAQTWRGWWWLPGAPDEQSPGQLVVGEDGGCRLELVGSLDLTRAALSEVPGTRKRRNDERVGVIHGSSRETPITLVDCFTISSDGFSATSRSRQDIHVHEALIGAHVEQEEPAFQSAIVEIENLTSWLAPHNIVERTEDGEVEHATTRRPSDQSCQVDGWTITARGLAQPFRTNQTRARLVLEGEVSTYLVLTPPEPSPARAFHSIVHELTDLITLAAGEASGQISLTLIHRVPTPLPQGDGTIAEISTRVESIGARIHTAKPDSQAIADWRFCFTCRDRRFDELVTEWLQLRRRAPEACNVYFGLKYARPRYTEIRLLLVAITVESLHKALVNSNALSDEDLQEFRTQGTSLTAQQRSITHRLGRTPTFRERALGLANKPDGQAVSEIITDVELWAGRLREARNNLAHTGNETSDEDIFHLEWVTSSMIALVLMGELGLSGETQQRAAKEILSPPS